MVTFVLPITNRNDTRSQVNFIPFMSPPEVGVERTARVQVAFQQRSYDQVLEQGALIVTRIERREAIDDGVADTQIPEVDFLLCVDFAAQVALEGRQPKNQEVFFQRRNVLLNGVATHAKLGC